MNNKIEDASAGGGSKGKNTEMKRLPLFATLLLVLLPISGAALFVITDEYKNHTEIVVPNQEILVHVATTLVKEKLDRAVDVGISLAGRPLLRQAIEKGKWGDALSSIGDIKKKFPYIDDIALYDPDGTLKVIASGDSGVIGNNFSFRDYYKGISNKWEPYISEVFKRAAEPKYNVVAVAIPIKSDDQKILGGFGIAIKLDTFQEWIKDINVGPSGSVYIVDQKGHLVVHHNIPVESDVVDYSLAPAVQKILKGESGVEVLSDPMEKEKQLIAYAPVPLYGWGVAVLKPESIAFQERTEEVIRLLVIFALGIFIIGFSLYRIIRDRKLMKAQRDREATLLESIGDGIVAIDRNWDITLWNKTASAITGWSKEEAMGKPFRTIVKLLRERDRAEDIAFIEDAMVRGKVTSMADNTLLVRKDGSEVHVGDSAAPIFGNGETPEGVIIVFRDVSLAIKEGHLHSDLAYATHQFRTPVTEALWNLEIGIDEEDTEKRKEDLRIAYKALLSVQKLSEHLVYVSEIDQGDISVKLSAVKFIDVLTEVQSKIEKEAKLHDVTLSIAPVSPLMAINTDKKLLGRILFEIVENAVIYSPRGSRVDVTTTLQEKGLLIEVVDAGVGVTEEEQSIIFTKFFRGSNRGPGNAGDGLGLYLAKAYVALLGGKIWFESVEGKGTTFYVSIPIA